MEARHSGDRLSEGSQGEAFSYERGSHKRTSLSLSYLKRCIDRMVLESQLPHKIVNLFSITKLTVLWGS